MNRKVRRGAECHYVPGVLMRALILALSLGQLFAQTPPSLPKGEVVSRVACIANPKFSYALYLPTTYREGRAWPVLFGFSPVGLGEEPVQLYRRAADRFGWIVVGSNDSRNGPLRPALEGAEAMWKDVHARFKVDPRQSYAAGLSGGARMALTLAMKHPKHFAGVISIGAFGTGQGLLTGLGHLRFYLGCGQEDFNHWEVLEGRRELESRGWKALADRFEGGHERAPEETAMSAMTFLQLGAVQQGWAAPDESLATEFRGNLERAAEKAGNSLLGLRRWQELASLFPDSEEGRRASQRVTVLRGEPSVAEELKLEEQYGSLSRELDELLQGEQKLHELNRLVGNLKKAKPTERLMIRRVLGGPILSYRIALGEALERKAWDRVLLLSSSLAALDEREGWPCIYAAAALVQMGKTAEGLAHLKVAQRRGYRKPERIRALPELKPLHGQAEFEAILRQMEPAPAP